MKKVQELQDLRNKEKKILFLELKNSEKKLAQLRFNLKLRKLKNFHEITNLRKRISRLWTILEEKTLFELEQSKITKKSNER